MGRAFEIIREEANGKIKVATSVACGGDLTAQQLADHLVAINAYPGAKKITVTEVEGLSVTPKAEELLRGSVRRAIDRQLRPLTTPRAEIKPKHSVPVEKRTPTYRNPGMVSVGGDGLGNLPASPVASPAAQEARDAFAAAHGLEGEQAAAATGGSDIPAASTPPTAGEEQTPAEAASVTVETSPTAAAPAAPAAGGQTAGQAPAEALEGSNPASPPPAAPSR